ncbi:MAG TPA: hypothetical protein VN642_16090 [Dongiaceae bacterium]|nr:hypothetical protein [Dongiaceae bacterium]
MYRPIFYCLSILLLLPLPSQAAPAITCHCFRDRAYDASRPALADPYFLATTQNSFFAALFNVDKKTIMMKKQSGYSADDLWVAYRVASGSGLTAEALLAALGKKGSWKEVVVPMGLPAKSLGERFAAEIAAGASSARLATGIVDDELVRHRLLGAQELAVLRKEWASNQEVILAALIASKSGRPAIGIYRDVKKGSKSWGAFLDRAKVQPSGMPSEFAALLK